MKDFSKKVRTYVRENYNFNCVTCLVYGLLFCFCIIKLYEMEKIKLPLFLIYIIDAPYGSLLVYIICGLIGYTISHLFLISIYRISCLISPIEDEEE